MGKKPVEVQEKQFFHKFEELNNSDDKAGKKGPVSFNLYHLNPNMPHGMSACVTKEDEKFARKNAAAIEK